MFDRLINPRNFQEFTTLFPTASSEFVSFDFETDGNDFLTSRPVGVSLSCDGDTSYYIPLAHPTEFNVPTEVFAEFMNRVIVPNYTLLSHNIQFDFIMMRKLHIDIPLRTIDTMQMANALQMKQLGLKTLAIAFNLLPLEQIKNLEQVLSEYFNWVSPDPKKIKNIFEDPHKYHCGMVDPFEPRALNYLQYCYNDAKLVIRLYKAILLVRKNRVSIGLQPSESIFD